MLCCETTVRDALMRDYRVFFLIDGTAAGEEDHQLATLKNLGFGFAYLITCDELIQHLGSVQESIGIILYTFLLELETRFFSVFSTFFKTSSNIVRAVSASFLVIISGGLKRMTFSPAPNRRSPFLKQP